MHVETHNWCSLFLTVQPDFYKYFNIFHIKFLPSPNGFTLYNGICDCDPYLVNSDLQINTCCINKLAVYCPANSWIAYVNESGRTHD